jgi:threonine dehydrogenase-like Zn-dependent dehydrogenase
MCERQLYSQCETTQNRDTKKGASLYGYTHLYGGVPGGQAQYLRVRQAQFGPIKVPDGVSDERWLFLSDVLPTAWQAVAYGDVRPGSVVAVFGLGPIGQMTARIARHWGAERVIGVDSVPERLAMAQRHGVETIDHKAVGSVPEVIRELTNGRGVDSGIDAVGMEADAGPIAKFLQRTKLMPDRFNALVACGRSIRRGGTLSLAGVYVGAFPLAPIGEIFDRQLQIRMGQANVRRWTDEIVPHLTDEDPLGVDDLVTHRFPLERAPYAYEIFQAKSDGCIKVVLQP